MGRGTYTEDIMNNFLHDIRHTIAAAIRAWREARALRHGANPDRVAF